MSAANNAAISSKK
ncbi:hypothetical protein YPPY88_3576, partial [Yersinia pestis PY-88]